MTYNRPGHAPSEHGVLGEARARAFLLNRFWVLERSVDVYGADFLIQRRLSDRNWGDRQRLGVIQVKYVQDGATSLTIPGAYVVDDTENPRGEFFLVVCTGGEDNERMFLLSASQIVDTFSAATSRSGSPEFRSGARPILDSTSWEVLDRRSALSRIEDAMAKVDFDANRRYLGLLGYVRSDLPPIEDEYRLPIQNGYGDVAPLFDSMRKGAAALLGELEWVAGGLNDMASATDPLAYQAIYDDMVAEYVGHSNSLSFDARQIYDPELVAAASDLRDYKARLERRGVLHGFSSLMQMVQTRVGDAVESSKERQSVHLSMDFDQSDLRPLSVLARLEAEPCEADGSIRTARLNEWLQIGGVLVLEATRSRFVLCLDGQRPPLFRQDPREQFTSIAMWTVQVLLHEQLFADDDCPHIHPSERL